MRRIYFALAVLWVVGVEASWASFSCEVLSIEGSAVVRPLSGPERPVAQGDLLSEGDRLQTQEDSTVDLSFDGEWNNIVRVEPATTITIDQVFPTQLALAQGGVYAKLKRLPSRSEFEIRTPTAVAAARGTEYRTTFQGVQTAIYNYSSSSIFIYSVESGVRSESSQTLNLNQKTFLSAGGGGAQPQPVEWTESIEGQKMGQAIQTAVDQAREEGRKSEIATVEELEKTLAPKEEVEEPKQPEDSHSVEDWARQEVEAFSADAILSSASMSARFKIYVSAGKVRMETAENISITRLDRNTVWMLLPSEKMYLEQPVTPEMAAQAMSSEGSVEAIQSIGWEKVGDLDAEKLQVVLKADNQTQTVYQWMVKGVKIPVKMQALDGSWSVEYQNLKEGAQPDGLFELPEGYSPMPEMTQLPQDAQSLEALKKQIEDEEAEMMKKGS